MTRSRLNGLQNTSEVKGNTTNLLHHMTSCRLVTRPSGKMCARVVPHTQPRVVLEFIFSFFVQNPPKNVENCVALIYFTHMKRGKHNYKKTLYEGRSAALNFLWPVLGPIIHSHAV